MTINKLATYFRWSYISKFKEWPSFHKDQHCAHIISTGIVNDVLFLVQKKERKKLVICPQLAGCDWKRAIARWSWNAGWCGRKWTVKTLWSVVLKGILKQVDIIFHIPRSHLNHFIVSDKTVLPRSICITFDDSRLLSFQGLHDQSIFFNSQGVAGSQTGDVSAHTVGEFFKFPGML